MLKKYLAENLIHIKLSNYLVGKPEFFQPKFSGLPKKPSEILTLL